MAHVVGDGGRITFLDRVNDQSLREYCAVVRHAVKVKKRTRLTLDFSRCSRAFPQAMLPIVTSVDSLHGDGVRTTLELPKDRYLAGIFENSNWAHTIDPDQHRPGKSPRKWEHMAATRFSDYQEQQVVVNSAIDVIISSLELERDVISALEWAVNEITDNVLNHASAPRGGFVQMNTSTKKRMVMFSVADAGRGIPATMREGFPDLESDGAALMEAVKQGVTRDPDVGQGNGLAGTLRIAAGSGGSFKLSAGRGELRVIRPPGHADFLEDSRTRPRMEAFHGTLAAIELAVDSQLSLSGLLTDEGIGHIDWDVVDSDYTSDDGSHMRLVVGEQEGGFGTRDSGRPLRHKVSNLLRAAPEKRLIVDWAGVPLVSSSYADEVVGKLFLELGPMAFNSRVAMIGMEPLVRSLIDGAIMQRVRQGKDGS